MKSAILVILIVLFQINAFTQEPPNSKELYSPFLPSVELRDSFSILNSHPVSLDKNSEPKIIRGMEPRDLLLELPYNGITDVLIFKTKAKQPVQGLDPSEKQMLELSKMGINTRLIPMPWKDIVDTKTACGMTIQALKYMKRVDDHRNRKMYFHCTVGEDRTGMLAGLFRMIKEKRTKEDVFQNEMCRWGYERGNPFKPYQPVVCPIRQSLTPLFLALAGKVEAGELSWKKLGKNNIEQKICSNLIISKDIKGFQCQTSSEEIDPSKKDPVVPEETCSVL